MQPVNYLLLSLILLTVGCGQTAQVTANQTSDKKITAPTEIQIKAAKDGNLTCAFSGECEPALALISIASGDGVDRCTGFMISDHQILTSDHCFSSVPFEEGACQGRVFVHLTGDVHRGCKSISVRSHQSGIDSKDYAVIELDAPITDRKYLSVARRGFRADELGTVFRVQMTESPSLLAYNGMQTKTTCKASYQTIMDINISSPKDPIISFGDCAIQEGNSGSPVFNESGEVGAVVQGFLNVKDDDLANQLKPYLFPNETYGEVALATQTSCMQEIVGNIAVFCNPVKPLEALYPSKYVAKFGGFLNSILPIISTGESWVNFPTARDDQKIFLSSPSCVRISEVMSGTFSFTSSEVFYDFGINARLQAEWRSMYQPGEKQVLFTVKKPANDKVKSVNFESDQFGLTVPVCAP